MRDLQATSAGQSLKRELALPPTVCDPGTQRGDIHDQEGGRGFSSLTVEPDLLGQIQIWGLTLAVPPRA